MGEKLQTLSDGSKPRNNAVDAHVAQQIIRYMLDNFDETVSLQCVAAHFGYEVCYFSKLFKRLMGAPYMQYRNRIRVEIAIIFLRGTDKTVTEVAGACGFSTVRNFNRVFRNVTGVTPSEARNMSEEEFSKAIEIPERQRIIRQIIQRQFAVSKKREAEEIK